MLLFFQRKKKSTIGTITEVSWGDILSSFCHELRGKRTSKKRNEP